MAVDLDDSYTDLIQLGNNQPQIMSTPQSSHIHYNPFLYGHFNTIAETPQITNTQHHIHSTPIFTNPQPIPPRNIFSVPSNQSSIIPPPAQYITSSVPNPSFTNHSTHTSQANPFMQHGSQKYSSNLFLGHTVNNNNPFLYSLNAPVASLDDMPVLKPKDVVLLKLSELQGVVADNRLNTFFRQVESCTKSDNRRIEVALARTEQDIATFITAELVKKGNNLSWDEIKRLMKKQFIGSATLLQAWQEITAMTYYSDEPPSSFINKLQCKISALTLKFPNDPIPTSDKFLKTKVFNGLSPHAQAKLSDFLAEHIPLANFMTYAEEEYYQAQGLNSSHRNRVLPLSGNLTPQSPPSVAVASQVGSQNEIAKLTKQLEDLSKKLGQLSKGKSNGKYCSFCRVTDHNISECPQNPPLGVCFDCYQPKCRRGRSTCPGPVNRNSIN